MLGRLIAPLRGLWAVSRGSWVDVGGGLRAGSGASTLYLFLFLVFCLVGGLLVALGFDLKRVDAWLDGHQTWIGLTGAIAFKALLAVLLFFSVLIGASGLWSRLGTLVLWTKRRGLGRKAARQDRQGRKTERDSFGWGAVIVAVILGYFAALGLFN